jgi:hypothetical protein
MAEYEVKFQIRVPTKRNSKSGAVKYAPSGYVSTPVKVTASNEDEARKIAKKSDKITKAKANAARGLDYDMPQPRVSIKEVKRVSGGGGMFKVDGTASQINKGALSAVGKKRQMNKGGPVKKKAKK